MRRLSIVIPNFNYGSYVGAAISSALAVEWGDLEVIVVDDGSTDDSVAVISRFGDQVTFLQQPNSGPRTACNAGYAVSTGDVVIFLDSDDMLDPAIGEAIADVWRPGISKVQFQMSKIDRDSRPTGSIFPDFPDRTSPETIRYWMDTTAAYPTPPGSGNAYTRTFLEQLFPLDARCGDATDSACLAAAPYLGDIVTVARPLVRYRVHGANRSYLLADPSRFTSQIERALQRHRFAEELAVADDRPTERGLAALFRGRHLLQLRVAQLRICPGHPPLPGDGFVRMLANSLSSVFAPGPEHLRHRTLVMLWCVATLVAPRPVARHLVTWRFRQG